MCTFYGLFLYRTPLMLAVANGHVDAVLYLIANGAIVNNQDVHGRTALHRGASIIHVHKKKRLQRKNIHTFQADSYTANTSSQPKYLFFATLYL